MPTGCELWADLCNVAVVYSLRMAVTRDTYNGWDKKLERQQAWYRFLILEAVENSHHCSGPEFQGCSSSSW